MNIEIYAQPTPNPNTLKFSVNRTLLQSGTADFPSAETAKGSPLAEELFSIGDVTGVFVGSNFISVTKTPESDWNLVVGKVVEKIRTTLASGVTLVANTTVSASNEGYIEQQIREILDQEIRPAVAMDGGDVTLHSYHNGIVTLHLRGACSHCPASAMTLKMGIEHRLKELIPEIQEVVQL
ncbi:MAG: NifU family protein [Deltaproteobacteria bacterium]|nr:NifU family protein [Deltaproteobacteria bacterium]